MNGKNVMIRSAVLALLLMALAGCSPDTQDDGQGKASLVLLKGGGGAVSAIAKGVAFVDLDRNGQLDSFEPFAITDAQGGTRSDVELCQGAEPPADCLLVNDATGPLVVRVQGGYEKVSGVPFVGRFATRIDSAAIIQRAADEITATPAEVDIVSTLKATLDDSQSDTLDAQLREGDALRLTGLLGALLGKVNAELNQSGDADQAGEIADGITDGLTKELIGEGDSDTPVSTADLVTNPSILSNLLGKVLGDGGTRKALDGRAAEIAELARLVLWASDALARENPGIGRLRAVQVLVAKAARVNAIVSELERDAGWVVNNPDQARAFYEALNDGDYDLQGLVDVPLSGDGAALAARVRIPEGGGSFAAVGGRLVDFSRQDEDEDIRVQLYFGVGQSEGSLRACLRYADLDGDDGYETEGTLIRGEWSTLDSYTIVTTLNLLGSRQSLTIRRLGEQRYRFNFNGEFSEYSGSVPTEYESASIPQSSADCKARLM